MVWHGVSALVLFLFALQIHKNPLPKILSQPLFPWVALLLAWGGISLAVAPCFEASFLSYSKIWVCLVFGFLAVTYWGERDRWLFHNLIIGAGILQAGLFWAGRMTHENFILIFPGNPQYGGLWCCVAFLLVLSRLLHNTSINAKSVRLNGLYGFLSFFLVVTLLFYPSRSALLAMIVGLLYLILRKWMFRGILYSSLILAVVFGLMPQNIWNHLLKVKDPFAWKRSEIWLSSIAGIKEKPLWGWGPGHFERLFRHHKRPQQESVTQFGHTTQFAHNEYLQVASTMGLPALVFLMGGIAVIAGACRKNANAMWETQSSVLAILVFSFFNFPFVLPVNGFLLAGFLSHKKFFSFRRRGFLPKNVMAMGRTAVLVLAGLLVLGNTLVFAGHFTTSWDRSGWHWNLPPWKVESLIPRADEFLHPPNGKNEVNIRSAEALYLKILKRCPVHPFARHALAHLWLVHKKNAQTSKGIEALQMAINENPYHAPWWMEMSKELAKLGHFEDSIRMANRALQIEPLYSEAQLHLARIYRTTGNDKEAKILLRALYKRENQETVYGTVFSPYDKEIRSLNMDNLRKEMTLLLSPHPEAAVDQ